VGGYAVEQGLHAIKKDGSQEAVLGQMQTRSRLYEVLGYEDYNKFDSSLYNFKLGEGQ
jgi:methylisocitrate lyase